jgi:hypothetical protein
VDGILNILFGALTTGLGALLIWAVRTIVKLRKDKKEAEQEKIEAEKDLEKTVEKLNRNMCEMQSKIDELIDISTHNGLSNKHLLSYRLERICLTALEECKKTGCKEIDKDLLARINSMHKEYKYFGGNSVIDKLVERVNQLHIVD